MIDVLRGWKIPQKNDMLGIPSGFSTASLFIVCRNQALLGAFIE